MNGNRACRVFRRKRMQFSTPNPHLITVSLGGTHPDTTFVPYYSKKAHFMNKLQCRTITTALILAIGITICPIVGAQTKTETYSSSRRSESTMRINHGNGYQNFSVEMRGKIEITDDDRDIKSMSPDGYLEITKTAFGSRRTLVISAQSGGLKREYYEGRTNMPWEPEGRKWLAEIMPELLRTTTIAAESRVNRFYKQGGVAGVLSEINRIESDYVKEHYASILMQISGVPAKEYASIVTKVTANMESDYYKAEFLQKGMDKFMTNREAMDAVLTACTEMDSDHYRTQIIKQALRAQPLSVESVRIVLAASDKMDSDHYKTEVLTTLLRQPNLSDPIVGELVNSTRNMDSDHYRTVVLQKALSQKNLSGASYQKVLESVRDIDSDHYKTQVLTDLLSNKLPTDQIFNLVNLSNSIESDHYLTIVFQKVLERQSLSDEAFKSLMDRAASVDSDHYASQILRSALDLEGLNDAKLIAIINAAGNVESDHYITEILTDAADKVRNSGPAVKEAYRNAARKIGSETYYGRAMKAVD